MALVFTSNEFAVDAQLSVVSISTIPDITLSSGETHDMSQYINDPQSEVVSTRVLGLNPAIATYSDTTKLLTGVAEGTLTGLQLKVSTQAWSYIGVPYPTDPVPSAIFPSVPTGADYDDHEWIGTYDPCTVEAPTPPSTVTANEYVVDKFHVSATDADQGDNAISGTVYGTTSKPRLTLPSATTYPAGTKFFVYGDDTPWPTDDSTNRKQDYTDWNNDDRSVTFNGTSANPVWLVGFLKPRIGIRNIVWNATHTLSDGIGFERTGPTVHSGTMIVSGQYVTFRNGIQMGGNVTQGGAAWRTSGSSGDETRFTMYYNMELAYFGNYNLPAGSKGNDYHGVTPQDYSQYMWFIDCNIHHLGADGIQVNPPGSQTLTGTQLPQYVYFAGNTGSRFKENFVDIKTSAHVIISENSCSDSEEDAYLISNNDEGLNTQYHWCIANKCTQSGTYGLGNGIRTSGDQSNEYMAIIGNFVYDISGVGLLVSNGNNSATNNRRYYSHNTVVRCTTGFQCNVYNPVTAGGMTLDVDCNMIYDCGTEMNFQADGNGGVVITVKDNILYDGGTETIVNEGDIDTQTNTLYTDPQVNNDTGTTPSDFIPGASGSAKDGNVNGESDVFQDFEDMYGIDIRKDILGTTRPVGTYMDIGAVERT